MRTNLHVSGLLSPWCALLTQLKKAKKEAVYVVCTRSSDERTNSSDERTNSSDERTNSAQKAM